MNPEQIECLKRNTCGMVENMETIFEAMKENGMSMKDQDKVDDAINVIYRLNQKYVKMEQS